MFPLDEYSIWLSQILSSLSVFEGFFSSCITCVKHGLMKAPFSRALSCWLYSGCWVLNIVAAVCGCLFLNLTFCFTKTCRMTPMKTVIWGSWAQTLFSPDFLWHLQSFIPWVCFQFSSGFASSSLLYNILTRML